MFESRIIAPKVVKNCHIFDRFRSHTADYDFVVAEFLPIFGQTFGENFGSSFENFSASSFEALS